MKSPPQNVQLLYHNHFWYVVENYLQLLELLGVLTPEYKQAKEVVEERFNPKMKKSSFDQFL